MGICYLPSEPYSLRSFSEDPVSSNMSTTLQQHIPSVLPGPKEDSIGINSISFKVAPYAPSIDVAAPYPPNTKLPLSLTPTKSSQPIAALASVIRELSSKGTIRELLTCHGGIYFQNLGLSSADEFSQFASAFGWVSHEDIGNPVRRTVLAYNVATANEGPNTQPVYPHNEFGLSPHYPAYVLFYCAGEPETGLWNPFSS